MRVLLLSENFPPVKGGSAIWLRNLYSRLAKHDVVYAAGTCQGDQDYDRREALTIERISMTMRDRDPTQLASVLPYLRVLLRVRRLCLKHKVDAVHCGKVLPEGFVAWATRLLIGTPYVVFCHGEEITTTATSRRYRYLVPRIYRNAEIVVANADNTARLLTEIGVDPRRIEVLRPSVDISQFERSEARAAELRSGLAPNGERLLLTVGRLQARKGHDMVIRALPKVLEEFSNVRYVIAGGGEERDHLEALARETGVADHVQFAGIVPDDDLPAYYGACDVFVMPNREIDGDFEGFGIVFLEAAACRKASVGGNSGGAREAVRDGVTGLLADGNQADSVADKLLELLREPARASQLGQAGFERVQNDFSYEAAARELDRIVRRVEVVHAEKVS